MRLTREPFLVINYTFIWSNSGDFYTISTLFRCLYIDNTPCLPGMSNVVWSRWFIDIKVNLSVFFHPVVPVSLPKCNKLLQLDHTQMNIFKIVLLKNYFLFFVKLLDLNLCPFGYCKLYFNLWMVVILLFFDCFTMALLFIYLLFVNWKLSKIQNLFLYQLYLTLDFISATILDQHNFCDKSFYILYFFM